MDIQNYIDHKFGATEDLESINIYDFEKYKFLRTLSVVGDMGENDAYEMYRYDAELCSYFDIPILQFPSLLLQEILNRSFYYKHQINSDVNIRDEDIVEQVIEKTIFDEIEDEFIAANNFIEKDKKKLGIDIYNEALIEKAKSYFNYVVEQINERYKDSSEIEGFSYTIVTTSYNNNSEINKINIVLNKK